MQYPTVLSRSLTAAAALGVLLTATDVRADIATNCTIMMGHLVCDGAGRPCTDDADCYANGLGRCVPDPSSPDAGVCVPECNDLFLCGNVGDCPTVEGLTNGCRPVPGLPNGAVGVCTYTDASDRQVVTVCAGSSTTFLQCFAGGSWAGGNCDGDMLLNAVDSTPCLAGGTAIAPVASPFCLPPRICEGTSDVCAPILRCTPGSTSCGDVADRIGATTPWECSEILTDQLVPFCHPQCDATAHCETDADCIGRGTCRQVDVSLAMCEPDIFHCPGGCPVDPLDWSTVDGDCDGDGAANACDPNPCEAGDSPCNVPGCLLPERDAGVPTDDAGVPEDDAGTTDDAAVSRPDGSTSTMDGSTSAGDAATIPVTPGLTFGGGGGCRCEAAGTGGERGSALLRLGLALGIVAGARRRARRPAAITRR